MVWVARDKLVPTGGRTILPGGACVCHGTVVECKLFAQNMVCYHPQLLVSHGLARAEDTRTTSSSCTPLNTRFPRILSLPLFQASKTTSIISARDAGIVYCAEEARASTAGHALLNGGSNHTSFQPEGLVYRKAPSYHVRLIPVVEPSPDNCCNFPAYSPISGEDPAPSDSTSARTRRSASTTS